MSKYLIDLGIKEEDVPSSWHPDDERQEQWKKEREIYGFDEKDIWNLDYTFALWIYPRLKMYQKYNCGFPSNMTKDSWNNILQEMIDGFEAYLLDDLYPKKEDTCEKFNKSMKLFSENIGDLWW